MFLMENIIFLHLMKYFEFDHCAKIGGHGDYNLLLGSPENPIYGNHIFCL